MKKVDVTKILYWFVLVSFIVPIVYLILKMAFFMNENDTKSRADYALMLVQCVLGILVINLPSLLAKKLKFDIPPALYIMYILFLYGAIFLGEVRSFYYKVPHWDDILHFCSSMMTGMFGFMLVAILNQNKRIAVNLSPVFICIFAFSFSVMIGSVWEIYEYTFDGILGLNMQKFRFEDGTNLVGHAALRDTMKDIIVDCCGALLASVVGFVSIKNRKGWTYEYIAEEKKDKQKDEQQNESTEN